MSKTTKRDLDGILLLDKPRDISSNNILQKIKRLFNAKKAGHTGALDPIATGMLPICFGEGTKFSQFLLDSDKTYQVVAKLGERTNTSDVEGEIIATKNVTVELEQILATIKNFVGDIKQVPTMFSALKHQGRPLYEYARKGITIEREARPITIYTIDFIEYTAPFLTLEVKCSKGTYIRTLIDDIGEKLGCGAHVFELRRIQVANYNANKMYTFEQLSQLSIEELDQLLLPIDTALVDFNTVYLDEQQSKDISFGKTIFLDNYSYMNEELVKIVTYEHKFIGIGNLANCQLKPKRLINTSLL